MTHAAERCLGPTLAAIEALDREIAAQQAEDRWRGRERAQRAPRKTDQLANLKVAQTVDVGAPSRITF
jgi:hypothetical protein